MTHPAFNLEDEEYLKTFPNVWRDLLIDGPSTLGHLFPTPGSVRWMLQTKRQRYVSAGALRKQGKRWIYNPRKYVRAWLTLDK
jgi:hypothetical protein